VDCLDISTRKVLYMGEESVGIMFRVLWEPRNEGLKVRIRP
jgi:hypothetical protein